VTAASDVFALGALVFATTGHLPYPGDTELAVARRMDDPPDLNGVPEPLRDVLRRCLAMDPADRPTVAGLLTILGPESGQPRYNARPIGVARAGEAERRPREARRGAPQGVRPTDTQPSVGASVCACVAVGLLAVELYWFYQLTHPARASQVALPAWLDGLFSFIAGVVWLFLMMIIICAVVWAS
jgi:hypothetical protein